ncbi:hypothetical protein ACHABX_11235 [Nesterenkonia halotolerans]|uniref:hypothetical protein n=1 Tax=Nesterenkonia halotolerans TaxID=225325 RepID=UPI003EE7B5B4
MSAEQPTEASAEQPTQAGDELSLDELETEVLRADALVQELSQRLKQTSDDRS